MCTDFKKFIITKVRTFNLYSFDTINPLLVGGAY